jgi:acyl-CoA reductase-like NAD-dependent aldehyde dehydrogenase
VSERLRDTKAKIADKSRSSSGEMGEYGFLVGGEWKKTGEAIEVSSPYDDSLIAIAYRAGEKDIEKAIQLAHEAFQSTRKIPSWKKSEILMNISKGIYKRREELARTIALEAGKPILTSQGEVDRAVFTFKVAAEEARRIYGEIVPLDWIEGTEGREAHIKRVPLGPISGITPFNFPLNLVVHKVAPALAAGCPIIIRPATKTPISALKLGEIILESGWPENAYAVVPSTTQDASALIEDERIKMLTFTGSPAVGWKLKSNAGRKRVALELGGNAGVIVNKDAPLEYAAERVAWGGFSYAGQSCISVQRIYIHEEIYSEFSELVLSKVKALKVGDPLDEATDIGPVIDRSAAERIENWIAEAKKGGASILTGGTREGNLIQPTMISNLKEEMLVSCQEVFGPVAGLYSFDDVDEAIAAIGKSEFGLQAGIFTKDMNVIHKAFDSIEIGGIMVNDVSTFRIDHMPYGGVKQSGYGREGLRYAIEEMTEMKLITFNKSAYKES